VAALNRPRRSVLYMPGSKTRALDKARSISADALIFDLEDAVAPSEKVAARQMVVDTMTQGGYGERELIIRINGLDTEWGAEDLVAAARAAPDAILIPKTESGQMVAFASERIIAAGAPEATSVWAMMETPRGFLRAAEIADAHPRLAAMVMGTNDLISELRAEFTADRAPVQTALSMCVLAARAAGIACIDGVYNAFRDDDGLRTECNAGRALGFDGKTLIHPTQVEIANNIFGPSENEIALAKEQVEAFETAEAAGQGVAVVNGKIVENLHVETAKRLIAEAEAIARLAAANS
jgi:citrate lyase beta subunit